MHQLRMAPDYPVALSLPLPLHLAGLAQAYVLPTVAAEDEEAETVDGEGASTRSDQGNESSPDEPEPDELGAPVLEAEAETPGWSASR